MYVYERFTQVYEEDLESTKALEAEKNSLEKKIMEAGGAQLRSQKAKVEGLSEELDSTQKEITKIQVSRKSNEAKIIKLRAAIESAESEIIKAQESVTKFKADQKDIEEKAAKLCEAYKAAQEALVVFVYVLSKQVVSSSI